MQVDRSFRIIVACDPRGGIGYNGAMPWYEPKDLAFFKKKTSEGPSPMVIMGRCTWEALPTRYRPLPNRKNIILSRQTVAMYPAEVAQAASLDEALQIGPMASHRFVIGGGQVYHTAMTHPACQGVYLTRLKTPYTCDTYFPLRQLNEQYQFVSCPHRCDQFCIEYWQRRRHVPSQT